MENKNENIINNNDISTKIKGVLIDLNGTIHVGDKLLCDVNKSLKILEKYGIKYCFITNNSKESTKKLVARLKKLGLSVDKSKIITASNVAYQTIKAKKLTPLLLIPESTVEEFQEYVKWYVFVVIICGIIIVDELFGYTIV